MANTVTIKNTKVNVGDIVKVYQKVKEKDKERTQSFSGVVIKIKGTEPNKSFTVRKIASASIGVERIWPINSPWITKVEVKKKGKVRKAKLYYLRERVGRSATRVKTVEKSKGTSKEEQLVKNKAIKKETKKIKASKTKSSKDNQ